MATTRTGHWSALFDTAPSSSAGEAIAGATGWRIIVEAAPVTTTHTTLTLGTYPPPSWVDITADVISISTVAGDASDWMNKGVGQATFTVRDLSATTGDPFDMTANVNNRFGTQSFIRWGLYDTNGGGLGWLPQFTGIIDSVVDEWLPDRPERTMEIVAFDAWYLVAGSQALIDYNSSFDVTVEAAVPALFTELNYPFSANWLSTSYSYRVKTDPNRNALDVFTELAASVRSYWWADGAGTLRLHDLSVYTNLRSTWYVLDGYATGSGGSLPSRAATVEPIKMRWVNSVDRLAYRPHWTSPVWAPGAAAGVATSPVTLSRKFLSRNDAPSSTGTTGNYALGDIDNDNLASYLDETSYLESAEFDTATADKGGQPGLATLIKFLAQTCPRGVSYTVQRRHHPAGYLAPSVRVDQVEQFVAMENGRFRWQARHGYFGL